MYPGSEHCFRLQYSSAAGAGLTSPVSRRVRVRSAVPLQPDPPVVSLAHPRGVVVHCLAPFDSGSRLLGMRLQRRRLYGGVKEEESDSGSDGDPGLWRPLQGVPLPPEESVAYDGTAVAGDSGADASSGTGRGRVFRPVVPSEQQRRARARLARASPAARAEAIRRNKRKTLMRCEGYRIAAQEAMRGNRPVPSSSGSDAKLLGIDSPDGVWGAWRDASAEVDPRAAAGLSSGLADPKHLLERGVLVHAPN